MSYLTDNGVFTFDGVQSSTYSAWISGGGTYSAAARKYEEYNVPGRNGTLTIDGGAFEEVDHTYTVVIKDSFNTNIQGLRNALMSKIGYKRLSDTYHTDEYYMAKYMTGLEPEVAPRGIGGTFALTFRRDPRRFLTSGESVTTLTATGSISNPTLFDARPLLRVYGTGTVKIGNDTITISANTSYTDIDCELRSAYRGSTNLNANISLSGLDFPYFKSGTNNITLSGVSKVEITPRWWRL